LISVCSKVDGNESLKHQRREIFKEKCNYNVFDNGDNDDGGNKDGDNNDSDNNDNVNNSQIIITSLKKAGEIIPILFLILVFTYLSGTNEAVILLDLEVLRYFRLLRCQMCRPYVALFPIYLNNKMTKTTTTTMTTITMTTTKTTTTTTKSKLTNTVVKHKASGYADDIAIVCKNTLDPSKKFSLSMKD
jgi:hypothetical protein